MTGLNQKKAQIQQKAFEAWNVDKFNTCILHTGMGKTFLFFKCLLSVDCKQVLMLAETNLREKNILDDAKQYKKYYGIDPLKGRKVVFMCYQSAYKTEVRDIFPEGKTFVFADEVHEMASEKRWDFVNNSDWMYSYFLGVTATLDNESVLFGYTTKYQIVNQFAPICFEYNIEEARIDGTTRDLRVFVYNHHLEASQETITAGNKKKSWQTTEAKQNIYLNGAMRKIMFMAEGPTKEILRNYITRTRCQFLYNLPSKIAACRKLLARLPGRTLVFGLSSVSLNALGIPAIVAENKNYKKDLEDFQLKKTNQIGANKMLLQGANLKDVDNIIYLSYYGKEGAAKQRAGRARQVESNEAAKIIIFRSIQTQEEKWFETMSIPLQGFNFTYVNRIEDCL